MQLLVYLLTYPLVWLIARLPFRLLYTLSDFCYFLIYKVFGYRKRVVSENLALAFPEMDEAERNETMNAFYRHFCDLFLESVKTNGISSATLARRYRLHNVKLLQELAEKKSVMVLFSHYGNWEWSIIINNRLKNPGIGVYKKIGNKYFDKLFKKIRAKWNLILVPTVDAVKEMVARETAGVKSVYGLVSDQSPMAHNAQYWRPFFGVTVPIYTGGVALAHKYNMAVLYAKVTKESRGQYSLEFIPITEHAEEISPNELADRFISLAEAHIKQDPRYYLWTHNRWKHRDKVPEQFL